MKNTFLLLILLLSACSPTQKTIEQDKADLDTVQNLEVIETKVVETESKEERLHYWYIYSNGNHKEPSDSLGWYRSDYEKSLALYNDIDNLSKTVSNIGLHLSIFKLENEKFALVVDSTTKIYKFIDGNYKQIISTNSAFATDVKIEQKRLNLDKFKDVLVEIPSGGTGGSEFLFLFYNPTTKSFDYDSETELRNIEFDNKKQKVVSHYLWSKATFILENNKFRKIDQTYYLRFSSAKEEFIGKEQVTKYDKEGKIISIDTVCIE